MKIYVDKDTKQIKAFERFGYLVFEGESFSDDNCDVFDIAENTKDYLIWYKYVDGELIENKPEIPVTNLETEIKNTINSMVLNVIPYGETLTPENVPSLVDIINPATTEESGIQANPIEIIDNDIAHNGYLYTYGKYYKWNNVIYLCKRGGIPDEQAGAMYGQKETLYFPPSALLGQYFERAIEAVSLSMSNRYTYTFGEYYDDEGVKYICKDVNALDPTESYGETFTSKFKPKFLVGRYFEVVK